MSTVYSFHIDWDSSDWMATPDFSQGIDDISAYVKSHYIERGKNQEQGNVQSGTLDMTLNNEDKRFSPTYYAGPLYWKIRPWLPVRVQTTINGGEPQTIYTGFISKLKVNPHPDIQEAYIYCTDGMDLLARNMVTQDETNRSDMNDGAAVDAVLDAAGWPAAKRSIDTQGSSIVKYPLTVEF